MPGIDELEAAVRLMIAALIGIAVGLEREWSGHASGPDARYAGLRTFLLVGLAGGFAGLLFSAGYPAAGTLVAGGAIVFAIVAYATATRRKDGELDGTTETAAIIVTTLGVAAGLGWLLLAAGAGSVVVLALSEKTKLHQFVGRIEQQELRAAVQFAVLALVVLPLLPTGPFLDELAFRPRLLWAIVLVISGLNFVGYLARRTIGADHGYGLTGLLAGLVSSTTVTMAYSRQSRDEPELSIPLARGVLGACTVMLVRIALLTTALAPQVGLELWPRLAPPIIAGGAFLALFWRMSSDGSAAGESTARNPLRLWSAIKMATIFQAGMTIIGIVNDRAGEAGLYVTGVLLGIAQMDALTVSMTRGGAVVDADFAARIIAVGVSANAAFKLALAMGLGATEYRARVAPALTVLTLAAVAGMLLL